MPQTRLQWWDVYLTNRDIDLQIKHKLLAFHPLISMQKKNHHKHASSLISIHHPVYCLHLWPILPSNPSSLEKENKKKNLIKAFRLHFIRKPWGTKKLIIKTRETSWKKQQKFNQHLGSQTTEEGTWINRDSSRGPTWLLISQLRLHGERLLLW